MTGTEPAPITGIPGGPPDPFRHKPEPVCAPDPEKTGTAAAQSTDSV
jgi:hypothetical protein